MRIFKIYYLIKFQICNTCCMFLGFIFFFDYSFYFYYCFSVAVDVQFLLVSGVLQSVQHLYITYEVIT